MEILALAGTLNDSASSIVASSLRSTPVGFVTSSVQLGSARLGSARFQRVSTRQSCFIWISSRSDRRDRKTTDRWTRCQWYFQLAGCEISRRKPVPTRSWMCTRVSRLARSVLRSSFLSLIPSFSYLRIFFLLASCALALLLSVYL